MTKKECCDKDYCGTETCYEDKCGEPGRCTKSYLVNVLHVGCFLVSNVEENDYDLGAEVYEVLKEGGSIELPPGVEITEFHL